MLSERPDYQLGKASRPQTLRGPDSAIFIMSDKYKYSTNTQIIKDNDKVS